MKTIPSHCHETNQTINYYIGLDVHRKNWVVTIRAGGMELKSWSMNPSPKELWTYLDKHYPDGRYMSAYEAGFSGFSAHRELVELGIENIVVHAADVPTTHKEKVTKQDKVDSRKLARSLESGELKAIHIPEVLHQEFRALCRLRRKSTQQIVRIKSRIKSALYYFGISLSEAEVGSYWSASYIRKLEDLSGQGGVGSASLELLLEELHDQRRHHLRITRRLREAAKSGAMASTIRWLMSLPGIGFVTAITLVGEIWDIKRFKKFDVLCSYLGLVPGTASSGEHERTTGMTPRRNKYLKHVMIEAAWSAVRKDVVLLKSFMKHQARMSRNDAIVRIARKLLNRVRYVWIHQTAYKPAVA